MAAAAYDLSAPRNFDDWAARAERWVRDADADLLVFPEYGAMELAFLDGSDVAGDLEASLQAAARHGPRSQEVWSRLARDCGCHILAPSGPWDAGRARPVNRAWLHGPGGTLGYQDKQVMTRFEREQWDVVPGDPLRVFRVGDLTLGVLICYDAEFPDLGGALIDRDVDVILVPSCTDSVAGFTRVRVGAMARALEGQCVCIHAPTVRPVPQSPAMDENRGCAAIYGPPDLGFPETGILAEGQFDQPGWVRADISIAALRRVRCSGHVLNRAHRVEARSAATRATAPPQAT